MYKKFKWFMLPLLVLLMAGTSCKKDYFKDTGVHKGEFNGSMLAYLKSRPEYFDSIVKVIDFAGMNDVFEKEQITFFAPPDSTIRSTFKMANFYLDQAGLPHVERIEQIKPAVWRQMLSRYLFKGARSLTDYPQLDFANIAAYPGQIYSSYDDQLINVGAVYGTGGGVPYAGYRWLAISYIPSRSSARDPATWITSAVATVNIHPTNGYIHVLQYTIESVDGGQYTAHYFGFDPFNFLEVALSQGIDK
ncbi:hypothetical protein [Niabella beijingensis]|uniref:hypothetical protein n=1 Tax=Niabella beijingensis TaxID=2872700 RepID=UPI001CBF2999|nr:hypothetical protein [Niabella beijingensis]MBZ4189077.1 hypothetical protein [Niabella beijingensis]